MKATEDRTPTTSNRRRIRFGLKLLLGLVLLIAVFLGAYEAGRKSGFDAGNRAGFAAGLNAKVYVKTYRVSDLLPSESIGKYADLKTLMDEIRSTIHPNSWDDADGPASLAPYPQSLSLVVSQTRRGHEEIADFLQAKRKDLNAARK